MIDGQKVGRLGGVGNRVDGPCVGADGEDEARTEGVAEQKILPRLTTFDTPSMPMAK
jgi:hypothetical protein